MLVICIIRSYCMSALRLLLSEKMKILNDISINTIKNSISHLEWFAYRINQQYINYFKESRGMDYFVNNRDDNNNLSQITSDIFLSSCTCICMVNLRQHVWLLGSRYLTVLKPYHPWVQTHLIGCWVFFTTKALLEFKF